MEGIGEVDSVLATAAVNLLQRQQVLIVWPGCLQ